MVTPFHHYMRLSLIHGAEVQSLFFVRCIWGTCSEAFMAGIPFSKHSFSLPALNNYIKDIRYTTASHCFRDSCKWLCLVFFWIPRYFWLLVMTALFSAWVFDISIFTGHFWVKFRCSWPLREKSWLKLFPVKMVLSLHQIKCKSLGIIMSVDWLLPPQPSCHYWKEVMSPDNG